MPTASGLAQLHQLRGRVARGAVPGICGVATGPLDDRSRERIDAFVATADGFELAALDHRLRGSGRLFGTRRSGRSGSRIQVPRGPPAGLPQPDAEEGIAAMPASDAAIIEEARRDAIAILDRDPGLALPEHARIRELIGKRREELAAEGSRHGQVG